MIIKSRSVLKCLYYTVSRQIVDSNYLCKNYGLTKVYSQQMSCPFYRLQLISTSKGIFNAGGETDSKESVSTTAVDALKNAVSKAFIMNSFDGSCISEDDFNKYTTGLEDLEYSSINTIAILKSVQKIKEKPDFSKVIENTKYNDKEVKISSKTCEEFANGSPRHNGKSKEQERAAKRRVRVDLSVSSVERNFITPARALSDFLLKPQDLETLKATKRRSPYENDPPITVYWRKDVEAKAIEVWGSKENLQKELLKRDLERKFHEQYLFANKKRLKDYRKGRNSQTEIALNNTSGLFGSAGKVVITAVAINGCNFLFKLAAWMYSGSHSMFSECIHSLADTVNQLILAFGIHKSVQSADEIHPYGYSNMKYVSSLISGVGIFCVGAGLSVYHGITGLYNPAAAESFFWAFCILGGSLVSEGATLLVAINSIRKGAAQKGMTFREYVLRGQEPSVNVVLLEDLAAVLGVIVAASCMGLTSVTGSHVPDAAGSLIIGGLLGCVASFIIYTNVAALVGRSISQEFLEKINAELESDVMIRAIHDVKGIDMGNCLVRYKAELDFDGRELAKAYLDTQNIHALLEEVQQFKTIDELELFILKHSENIIDKMGAEIDRIEVKLRTKFPEIRHCDLEIL